MTHQTVSPPGGGPPTAISVCVFCLYLFALLGWGPVRRGQWACKQLEAPRDHHLFGVNALDLENTPWLPGSPPLMGCSQSLSRVEGVARGGGVIPCRELLGFSHPAVIGLKANPRSLGLDEILGISSSASSFYQRGGGWLQRFQD